jgi:hypothetical protein
MKKLITGFVGALAFALLLGAAADTLVTQRLIVQQTSNLATATAASLSLSGAGTPPILTQCNASPPSGSTAKGSLCLDPTNGAPFVYNGTAWTSVGGGAGTQQWAPGTYAAGATAYEQPYLFAANSSTTTEPCISYNSVASNAIWQINGTGASQDSTLGTLTLVNSTSQNSSVIYKFTTSGWNLRTLVVDVEVTGTADGFSFGILDGARPATTAPSLGMSGVAGFWGADLEIYSGGAPGYYSVHNGVQDGVPFADNNANMTNAGTNFDRYYLDFVDNGVGANSVTMTLRRNAYPFNPTGANTNVGWSVDTTRLGVWTVGPRPTFTSWRFAFGGHTGGFGATFKILHAWALSKDGTWTVIGLLPTRT